jgi:hypothetical integral membrane protein (TIGR02206 family)
MFTLPHFIWLAAIILAIVVAIILIKKFKPSYKFVARILLILSAILKVIHIATSMEPSEHGGMVMSPTNLAFHLCSLQIFFVIFINFSKNEDHVNMIKSFMVPSMLIGAFLALIIPTEGCDALVLRVWQYFLIHGLYVFYGLYLLIVEKVDMSFKAYRNNFVILLACASAAFTVNSILKEEGSNYLYLRKPPMDGLPVLNLNNGWYVYIITLASVAVILITLVHLPYLIKDIKTYKEKKRLIRESQIS